MHKDLEEKTLTNEFARKQLLMKTGGYLFRRTRAHTTHLDIIKINHALMSLDEIR